MKKLLLITASALLIALVLVACSASKGSEKKDSMEIVSQGKVVSPIIGTWMLDSYKYQSSSAFIKRAVSSQRILLITDKMFMWSTSDPSTRKTISSAGGTYTMEGDKCTESIDFGFGMDSYVGTKSTFTVKVDGDFMFKSGKLADGYIVEEVWIRVK